MNRKYVYIIFSATVLSFLLITFYFVGSASAEPTPPQDAQQVENPPFKAYITGLGIVEPVSGNITISSPFFNRIVEKINVAVNDQVKKGEVLFQLYNEDLRAALKIKQEKYEESLSNLRRLEALPREEDLTIARETFNKAQAAFNEAVTEYCLANRYGRSKTEKCLSFYKYQQAEADFLAAKAQFEKVKSGTWQPELKIAKSAAEQARADVKVTELELERTYVKSPLDGTVLQIKIHEGEILDQSHAPIILGNITALNLRVSIDQFNEPRFNPFNRAVAFKQGDTTKEFPLEFILVEPIMLGKKYVTNALHEVVDTQIFEILYRIETNENSHLFIGEKMDVYIYQDEKPEPASDRKRSL